MMLIFFDETQRGDFFPLTLTRPTADLRIGILKISEKWQQYFKADCAYKTDSYLSIKFPFKTESNNLFINGTVCPDADLVAVIDKLNDGEALLKDKLLIALNLNEADAKTFSESDLVKYKHIPYSADILNIQFPEDIFQKNSSALNADFELITNGRTSASLSATNTVIGNRIFVEEGVEAECATFNTHNGNLNYNKTLTLFWMIPIGRLNKTLVKPRRYTGNLDKRTVKK